MMGKCLSTKCLVKKLLSMHITCTEVNIACTACIMYNLDMFVHIEDMTSDLLKKIACESDIL